MAYSNRQSFHSGLVLQNATALPANYYAELTNSLSVRPISRHTPAIVSIHESIPVVTEKIDSSLIPTVQTQAPEKQISPPVSTERIPVVSEALRPAITIDTTPVLEQGGKVIWKPGHGLVEKVDKLTGEIVHLAEK
jgi:hypothetical protein